MDQEKGHTRYQGHRGDALAVAIQWPFWMGPMGSQGPTNMGVSKNSGIPKWMVYNGKP